MKDQPKTKNFWNLWESVCSTKGCLGKLEWEELALHRKPAPGIDIHVEVKVLYSISSEGHEKINNKNVLKLALNNPFEVGLGRLYFYKGLLFFSLIDFD